MAQHTIKGYIVWEQWKGSEAKFQFQRHPAYSSAASGCTQFAVCAHEITFDDGGFDPRPSELAELDKQERKLRAAFAATLMEIGKRRSELLAITNEVA